MNENTSTILKSSKQDLMPELSDEDFNSLRQLVSTYTGISLSDKKSELIYGRISKRLRALGLHCFGEYCDLLKNNPGDELEHFSNAVTTNLTAFFREAHHFEYLAQQVVPLLLERYSSKRRLRIWSAGCSTGEEAYSIAMTLRESIPDIDKLDICILASDLDTNVLQVGAGGIYHEKSIEGLSDARRRRWFQRGKGQHNEMVRVAPELRNMITFKQLNLMDDWPMQGLFDVIFCRNVVIYFDKPTQRILFERFANVMHQEGHLFIGHSETLSKINDRFHLIDKTIYRGRAEEDQLISADYAMK